MAEHTVAIVIVRHTTIGIAAVPMGCTAVIATMGHTAITVLMD